MAVVERDINGAPFIVGDYVNVRCLVSSITTSAANGTGGPADTINLIVETPGNVGDKAGVTLAVSSVQCRRAGNTKQP